VQLLEVFMIRKLFIMLGILGVFGISFDLQCETWGEWITLKCQRDIVSEKAKAEAKAEARWIAQAKQSNETGFVSRAFCAVVAAPAALAQSVQKTFAQQEAKKVEPWFWQNWQRPTAVDVATSSLVPWYAHAAHGYLGRWKHFNATRPSFQNMNAYKTHVTPSLTLNYSSMWQRVKALDFRSFNKWHPIQSMKGSKRMIFPLVGPIIAAHATGLAYHAAVEHTPRAWYRKQVSGQ